MNEKTGKALKFAAVLPATRFTWAAAQAAIRVELAYGKDQWTLLRRTANYEASAILLDPLAHLDASRNIMSNLLEGKISVPIRAQRDSSLTSF
jgi:hypothetical protein